MPRAIKYSIVSVFSFVLPLIASARFLFENDPEYLFTTAAWAIRWIISLLLGVATLVFFWGVISYVIAQGDETKLKAGRKYMVWGIIGLVVIASAWGIANLIIFTMFGETAFSVPGLGSDFGGGGPRNALSKCPICLRCTDYIATPLQCGMCDTCLAKQSIL